VFRRCYACDLPNSYHDFWYLNRDVKSGLVIERQQLCFRCYETILRNPSKRKYNTKEEQFQAHKEFMIGRPSPRKGKRLIFERECYGCGSQTTYTNPKTGKRQWCLNHDKDGNVIGYFCHSCNLLYYANPKRIGNYFQITYKDKRIRLESDPKTGFCSECGKATKTHMHHDSYDDSDPLANTRELCESCHGKDSARRRYQKVHS